ncbi:MAG: type IV secretion system DNA-binding domain-containing protein [Thermoguttaceae bacterium]
MLRDGSIHISGPAFGYQKEYEQIQQRRAKRLASDGAAVENWPRWGPLLLDSPRAAQSHCCIMGPAAGGTDVLLRILMQSVANYRWLLFDGRNDMFPAIAAIRPYEEIHLLNPLDARASTWDIPADCATPQQAQAVVVALLPADSHHDPLLLESARTVLAAIIQAFISRSPGHWNLMQFLAATETHNLKTVLTSTASTDKVYRTLRANPHRQLIATFLQSRLQLLKPVAAAWQHAARKISIASWLQSRSALVLGNSIRSQHLLAPLNRLLFQLLTSNLLEPQIVSPERTWVFLSDLCQIGRLEPLATLLARGAAAGVTVAITAEDVEMLQRQNSARFISSRPIPMR